MLSRPGRALPWATRLAMLLAMGLTHPAALAQEPPVPDSTPPGTGAAPAAQQPPAPILDADSVLVTLQALAENLAEREAEVAALAAQVDAERDPERRADLLDRLRIASNERDRMRAEREALATGLDAGAVSGTAQEPFNLTQEAQELLEPLIEELKKATEKLRQEDRLRRQMAYLEQQRRQTADALQRLELLTDRAEPGPVRDSLEELHQRWLGQRRRLDNELTVARYQLEQMLVDQKSKWEIVQENLAEFVRTRGKNLTLAFGTFFAVFVGLRFLYYALRRRRRRFGRSRSFYSRLFMVVFFFCATLAATVAGLLVLYAAQDWVLFVVAVIVLLGFLWASRHAVPLFLEQLRMLLNLGSVREGERVILDGVPWHVSSLSLYTTLTNPLLSGGLVRVPIRDLVTMRSRPCATDEVWFPCRQGEWVLLDDGGRGRVHHQSPEFVVLELAGAGTRTLPTLDFLGQHPRNLSQGFRLLQTFGIDYGHQADATTRIREQMERELREGLAGLVGAEHLQAVRVEFQSAGASSLDYAAIVDVAGTLAERYDFLRRAIQRLLVDSCNTHGWVIPFQQITVHRAD